ncbi:MAG: hypothetical protein IPL79_08510 [Myxococcales bacterium]|nr:hypothetical protein [Myxococcales bacterium]
MKSIFGVVRDPNGLELANISDLKALNPPRSGTLQLSQPSAARVTHRHFRLKFPFPLQGFFIGQVVKKSGGRADPATLNQLLAGPLALLLA